jgi:hypothetical protein
LTSVVRRAMVRAWQTSTRNDASWLSIRVPSPCVRAVTRETAAGFMEASSVTDPAQPSAASAVNSPGPRSLPSFSASWIAWLHEQAHEQARGPQGRLAVCRRANPVDRSQARRLRHPRGDGQGATGRPTHRRSSRMGSGREAGANMNYRTLICMTSGKAGILDWVRAAKEEPPAKGKPLGCAGCPLRVGGEWSAGAERAAAFASASQRRTLKRCGCHEAARPCAGMRRILAGAQT